MRACLYANLRQVPLEQFSGFWKEDPEVKRFVHIFDDDMMMLRVMLMLRVRVRVEGTVPGQFASRWTTKTCPSFPRRGA